MAFSSELIGAYYADQVTQNGNFQVISKQLISKYRDWSDKYHKIDSVIFIIVFYSFSFVYT